MRWHFAVGAPHIRLDPTERCGVTMPLVPRMSHPIDPLFQQKLDQLRPRMKRSIKVPSSSRWRVDLTVQPTVVVAMDAPTLGRNLQSDAAAAPCFALCLAWWFEHFRLFGDSPVCARVELPTAWAPTTVHENRSAFLLRELAHLLPGRFACAPTPGFSWPEKAMLNAALADREAIASPQSRGEHAIEVAFTRQPDVPAQFAAIDAVEAFRRQLPLGLFDGAVSRDTHWSPGGASQVDLWSPSCDGRTVHLFELKKDRNSKVGIIPEALWYARLLHRVRTRDFGGRDVQGGGPEMDTIRRAERIMMWLLVQDSHPLVLLGGESPLAWLRDAMTNSGVSIGVLFYEYDPTTGRVTLHPHRRWT